MSAAADMNADVRLFGQVASQKDTINEHEIERGDSFGRVKTRTQTLQNLSTSSIKYDLLGKIALGTTLTRKTVAQILKGMSKERLAMFKVNPEEFISKMIKLIKEQKASVIVEHISYSQIDGEYSSNVFTKNVT